MIIYENIWLPDQDLSLSLGNKLKQEVLISTIFFYLLPTKMHPPPKKKKKNKKSPRAHLHEKPIFANESGTWLSRGSYEVYVAVTGPSSN